MAHQMPPLAGAVANAANVLGTAATLSARPTGEERSKEPHISRHVPPPPNAPELQGGLAGVRQTAEVANVPKDHSTPGAAQTSLAHVDATSELPGVTDQLPNVATEAAMAGDDDAASAAVATHVGPEVDPYHLAGDKRRA